VRHCLCTTYFQLAICKNLIHFAENEKTIKSMKSKFQKECIVRERLVEMK
jgi:hypothetical protein